MTIADVAARLNVNVRHVPRLVEQGRIPYIKWGHLLRFDPDEIEAWIAHHHIAATRPPLRCVGRSSRAEMPEHPRDPAPPPGGRLPCGPRPVGEGGGRTGG